MKVSVIALPQAASPLLAHEHDDALSSSSKSSMDEGTGSNGTSSRSGSSSSEDSVGSCNSSDSGIAMPGSGSSSKSSSPDAEMATDKNNNDNNNNDTDNDVTDTAVTPITSENTNINNDVIYDNAGNALTITSNHNNRMLVGKNFYNNQNVIDHLARQFASMRLRNQPINIVHLGALTAVVPTTITMPSPVSPTTSMELVWHGEFDRLFSQYLPHMWYLTPTFFPPGDRFQVFKDSAKVRFSCQCGHGWTSMKGRVVFWFYLNYCANSGYVLFKLYGQQCQRCKNDRFEHSMWYPEEVIKVIGNVYNRVGQIFYGFVRPPLRIDRRQGKPRNQHQSELCLACKEGLCKEEWVS